MSEHTSYTNAQLQEMAALGATMLDEQYVNWASSINLDGLDMAVGDPLSHESGCGCILAQLYDTFEKGREWLGHPDFNQLEALGFVADFDEDDQMLTAAWTELVKART